MSRSAVDCCIQRPAQLAELVSSEHRYRLGQQRLGHCPHVVEADHALSRHPVLGPEGHLAVESSDAPGDDRNDDVSQGLDRLVTGEHADGMASLVCQLQPTDFAARYQGSFLTVSRAFASAQRSSRASSSSADIFDSSSRYPLSSVCDVTTRRAAVACASVHRDASFSSNSLAVMGQILPSSAGIAPPRPVSALRRRMRLGDLRAARAWRPKLAETGTRAEPGMRESASVSRARQRVSTGLGKDAPRVACWPKWGFAPPGACLPGSGMRLRQRLGGIRSNERTAATDQGGEGQAPQGCSERGVREHMGEQGPEMRRPYGARVAIHPKAHS